MRSKVREDVAVLAVDRDLGPQCWGDGDCCGRGAFRFWVGGNPIREGVKRNE